ncbi:MAG TPA: hypothetical protein VJ302_18185 [Blastocatellia bacterium]|nr:hypothetical protein [Blastocatellia bacterium]
MFGSDDQYLSPEAVANLYRIAPETLNNISKHAQSSQAEVILESRAGHRLTTRGIFQGLWKTQTCARLLKTNLLLLGRSTSKP